MASSEYLADAHRQLYAESQDSFSAFKALAFSAVHGPWLKY